MCARSLNVRAFDENVVHVPIILLSLSLFLYPMQQRARPSKFLNGTFKSSYGPGQSHVAFTTQYPSSLSRSSTRAGCSSTLCHRLERYLRLSFNLASNLIIDVTSRDVIFIKFQTDLKYNAIYYSSAIIIIIILILFFSTSYIVRCIIVVGNRK